jgi:hypothetical protein
MGFKDYVSEEQLKKAGEGCAKSIVEHIVKPAAKKLVEDSETKWDDMAFALLEEFLDDVVEKIHEDEVPAE